MSSSYIEEQIRKDFRKAREHKTKDTLFILYREVAYGRRKPPNWMTSAYAEGIVALLMIYFHLGDSSGIPREIVNKILKYV